MPLVSPITLLIAPFQVSVSISLPPMRKGTLRFSLLGTNSIENSVPLVPVIGTGSPFTYMLTRWFLETSVKKIHSPTGIRRGQIQVQYTLPRNDNVKMSLFTGFGALIDQKISGVQHAGTYMHTFNLGRLPAGTYIVKVSAGSYHEARPINIR